jgi:cytochrome c556
MFRSKSTKGVLLGAMICAGVIAGVVYAQETKLAAFMRQKLYHSEKTLEGLTTENYDLVAKHSQAMSLLCQDEQWATLRTKEYAERSTEFRRSVDAITSAAREKNLDAATLAYVDATMQCISCHKYVRQQGAKP